MKTRSTARYGWLARWVVAFALLLLIGSTYGQPLNIVVSNAQYSTFVEGWGIDTNGLPLPPVSRATTSSSPISDEIDVPFHNLTCRAIASAGLFELSTWAGLGNAGAWATNQLWFSPLVDQTQTMGIQIGISFGPDTGGSISLLDLTSNSELWNYGWNYGSSGWGTYSNNIPLQGSPVGSFNEETEFFASHQYELTMTSRSGASSDEAGTTIQLTGLQVVPEPSSLCLLLFALLGLQGLKHRKGS